MNKKLIPLIILVLFIPAIVGGIWMLSMTGDSYTVANVSLVRFVLPDGKEIEYISEKDKEFFVDFKDNIVSIEKQDYDEEMYSLYRLDFERVKGDSTYYLCLSADVKNCLAYDDKGNWYRIDKEYAKSILTIGDVTHVYKNSDIPTLTFKTGGNTVTVEPTVAKWYYLLADESYSEVLSDKAPAEESILTVIAHDGFEFDFSVEPDWYNIKIFNGELVIYDGNINSVSDFSNIIESSLRAVVTAKWYDDVLYNGEATYEFVFDYDIKASYTLSKDSLNQGDTLYINITNATDETLELSSTLPGVSSLQPYTLGHSIVVSVPIPVDAKAGEYRVNVKSDRTSLSIPFTVAERNFSTDTVGFVGSESASEYNDASASFKEQISLLNGSYTDGTEWINGMLTPAVKYVGGKQQYWVSSPSYGVMQKVDGYVIEERGMGVHYVKSVDAEDLPVRVAAKGKVVFSNVTELYGNTVVIDHGLGLTTVYGHLDSLTLGVGDTVEAGQVFAKADPSGFAVSSTEFFFGVRINGMFVNPYKFIVDPKSPDDSDRSDPFEFLTSIN